MGVDFVKMQGTGNDFVLIDQRKVTRDFTQNQIALLCHRRFGIGADGLLILRSSEAVDFEMLYYNSDGAPSSMCGNGGRCIVKYAYDHKYIKEQTEFLAPDGLHRARINDQEISLEMNSVDSVLSHNEDYILNTGSPHFVTFVKSLSPLNVAEAGRSIRYSTRFAEDGINVNFVELLNENQIFVRTYERGVEDETLSCGTGVTAAAIATHLKVGGSNEGKWSINTKGGVLKVSFKQDGGLFKDIELHGPAAYVYKGRFENL